MSLVLDKAMRRVFQSSENALYCCHICTNAQHLSKFSGLLWEAELDDQIWAQMQPGDVAKLFELGF